FVGSAWPGWHVVAMRELRQLGGIVLENGSRAVQLRARASSHADASGQTISVEIFDPVAKRPFYRATAVLLQQMPAAPDATLPALDGSGRSIDARTTYGEYLFHGPRFQRVEQIDALQAGGIDARLTPSQLPDFIDGSGQWLFDLAL